MDAMSRLSIASQRALTAALRRSVSASLVTTQDYTILSKHFSSTRLLIRQPSAVRTNSSTYQIPTK